MAEIRPFRALRYRVPSGDLWKVLAPPYDVISSSYRDALYARDPRNIVRVVHNRTLGDAGYHEAAEVYRQLRSTGVLAQDDTPGVYVLEQRFDLDGDRRVRLGFIASCRAEDPATGRILPHEHTRAAAREDRWRVIEATQANFSPVFLMIDDPDRALAGLLSSAVLAEPTAEYTDDGGVVHRLFPVTDTEAVSRFTAAAAVATAYIADGHHRYATALRRRDTYGPEGAWTMAYLTPARSEGLIVLPYHRVLLEGPDIDVARERLGGYFRIQDVEDARVAAAGAARSTAPYAFGFVEPGGGGFVAEALLEAGGLLSPEHPPQIRALDTFFLHHVVLPTLLEVGDASVQYVHSLREAEAALEENRCRLAVLLRGTPIEQIVGVARAGLSMPPKSTYFHPKLPSGLVIHPVAAP